MSQAKGWIYSLTLLSLGATVAFFSFGSSKNNQPSWQVEDLKSYSNWYQINWYQQAIGWSRENLTIKGDSFVLTEEDFIEGRVADKPMQSHYLKELHFSKQAPYQLVSGSIKSKQADLDNAMFFTNNQQLEVLNKRNGKEYSFQKARSEFTLNDYFAANRWAKNKPQEGEAFNVRLFDESQLVDRIASYQMFALEDNKSGQHLIIKQNLQSSGDSAQSWYKFKPNGEVSFIKRASGMQFIKSAGKVSLNTALQKDLYFQSAVKIDRPLGDIHKIESLVLQLEQGRTAWLKPHNNLQITAEDISLKVTNAYPSKADERQFAYQELSRFADNPKILQMAKSYSKKGSTKLEKVTELNAFVNQHLAYEATPANLSINEILNLKKGDCTEYTNLLQSMLAAIDIPSRQVSGLIYLGDEKQQFGGHQWLEVLIDDNWHGVDPTWNLMTLSSAHIPLDYSNQGIIESIDKELKFSFKVKKLVLKQIKN